MKKVTVVINTGNETVDERVIKEVKEKIDKLLKEFFGYSVEEE